MNFLNNLTLAPDGAPAGGASPSVTPTTTPSSSAAPSTTSESSTSSGTSEPSGTNDPDEAFYSSVEEQLDLDLEDVPEGDGTDTETPAQTDTQTQTQTEPQGETQPAAPAAQPQEQSQTQQPQTQQPQTQQSQEPQLTPEQWQAQLTQWRNQAIDVLSTQVYTISEEEAQLLQTEPEKILPKMAARVHIETMQAAMLKTMEFVQRWLPQAIEHYNTTAKVQNDFETEFFSAFPKLKGADSNRLAQLAQVYRQSLNGRRPTREELINEVGKLGHAMLGIPLDEPTQQQPTTQVPSSPPFVPSAARGTTPARPQTPPKNEFEALVEAMESGQIDV